MVSFTDCRLGYGAMNLTWKPEQTPDEQAFKAIKTAVDGGCSLVNSGEFYGQPDPTLGLKLLARFFEANADYIDKTYVAVKGGLENMKPNGSLEGLRKSVENINTLLGGKKKMDHFEMARVDQSRSIEEAMKNMMTLRDEGHFKDIGLSESSAETIRRAAKVGPVASVEVEYSPWSLDIEHNGVLDACKELKIPIWAYSPLGKGFLTGSLKSPDDIPEGDHRKHFDRFQPENFGKNLELVEKLQQIAKAKGVPSSQLCLAWEMAQWEGIYPIPGSTRPEGVKESLGALNVKLTEEENKQIREIVNSADVAGYRYNAQMEGTLFK